MKIKRINMNAVMLITFLCLGAALITGCEHVPSAYSHEVEVTNLDGESTTVEVPTLDVDALTTAIQQLAAAEGAQWLSAVPTGDVTTKLSDTARTGINGLAMIPTYGGIASLATEGFLSILSVFLFSRLRTSTKVSQAMVQGIDTFRDILDQTPQGGAIDAALTRTLATRQAELSVTRQVSALLARYQTPAKAPIVLGPPRDNTQSKG